MAKKKRKGGGQHQIRPAAFKLGAIRRMEAGECVAALSRELGVRRKLLYQWRAVYRERGRAALERRPGRERRSSEAAGERSRGQAARRIAELERKVGRQALQIDFLRRAFKRVAEARQSNSGSGGTASTGRSGA
jgi:hypothetical protein